MKRLIAIAGALTVAGAYFVLSALPALSADSGTVDASVSVAAPCLTVVVNGPFGPQLNFGTRGFTTPTAVSGTNVTSAVSVTNCSTGAESAYVRGTDARSTTSSATWTLQSGVYPCSVGANKYSLETHLRKADGTFPSGTGYAALTATNQLLESGVGPGSRDADIALAMPCSGSDGAGETMAFQITYSAAL
jgi:hypothetical protein